MAIINMAALRVAVDRVYKIPENRTLDITDFTLKVMAEEEVREFRFSISKVLVRGIIDSINKEVAAPVDSKLHKMGNVKTDAEAYAETLSILKTNQGYSYLELRQELMNSNFVVTESEAKELYDRAIIELSNKIAKVGEKKVIVPKKVEQADQEYKTVEELVGPMPEKPAIIPSAIKLSHDEVLNSMQALFTELAVLRKNAEEREKYVEKLTQRLGVIEAKYKDLLSEKRKEAEDKYFKNEVPPDNSLNGNLRSY